MKMPIKSTLTKGTLSENGLFSGKKTLSGNEAPEDAPKIEFPCANYPIKVVGKCIAGYDAIIIELMRRYDPSLDVSKVHAKDSAKGTFRSITLYITATGKEQLEELHIELTSLECVKMVM
jgi:putative lipoic acid-binding regulatory protein